MVKQPEEGALASGGLLDLRGKSMAELIASDASPQLRACAARVVDALDDPDGIISAFQSFASQK